MFCNKCGIDVRNDGTCDCDITNVKDIINWSVKSDVFDTLFDYPKNFFLISDELIAFRVDGDWESYMLNKMSI